MIFKKRYPTEFIALKVTHNYSQYLQEGLMLKVKKIKTRGKRLPIPNHTNQKVASLRKKQRNIDSF